MKIAFILALGIFSQILFSQTKVENNEGDMIVQRKYVLDTPEQMGKRMGDAARQGGALGIEERIEKLNRISAKKEEDRTEEEKVYLAKIERESERRQEELRLKDIRKKEAILAKQKEEELVLIAKQKEELAIQQIKKRATLMKVSIALISILFLTFLMFFVGRKPKSKDEL